MQYPTETRQPDLFTVEEAAAILRVGRTIAYEQARRFEATNGKEGIPVIRIGRLMRVPRVALERWIGAPIATAGAPPNGKQDEQPTSTPKARTGKRRPTLTQDALPLGI